MNTQRDGCAGSGSDSWLDANFQGRDGCVSWTEPLCSLPGTLTGGLPAVPGPDLPQNLDDLVLADSKHSRQCCPLLAPVQRQKLNHGPHRTQLFEEFWENHDTSLSKPDSPFLPFSQALQNDALSTKVNRNLHVTAQDDWAACGKP